MLSVVSVISLVTLQRSDFLYVLNSNFSAEDPVLLLLSSKMAAFIKSKIFKQKSEEELRIHFESFTKLSFVWFKLVLFDFEPLDEYATTKKKLAHAARQFYVKISIICLNIAFGLFLAYIVANSEDFATASKGVPNSATIFLIALKAMATYYRREDIWKILQELKVIFENRVRGSPNFKVKKYFDEYHFHVKIYAATFLLTLVPIAFPAIPFILYGIMENKMNYWFPFDIYRRSTFPLVLLWTDFVALNSSLYLLGCDSILYALITLISMEFDAVKVDFMDLTKVAKNEQAKTASNLVDRHNKLLDLSDMLQDIYGIIFFFSFFISSLILCFIGFQLSINSENSYFAPLLGLISGQILLLCVFGQKLIDSTHSIAEGIYNCGWDDLDDNDLKKQFILIILRANKCKRLTAMKFADISLQNFTGVSDLISNRHFPICTLLVK